MKYRPRCIKLIFFTLVTECTPLPCVFPLPRIFVGTTVVSVAGKGLVNDGRVAACDKSLFNESASSERKKVVVFPAGVSLNALVVVALVETVRDDWDGIAVS